MQESLLISLLRRVGLQFYFVGHRRNDYSEAINHEIALLPGAKLPAKNAYRMAPPELAEFQKKLDE